MVQTEIAAMLLVCCRSFSGLNECHIPKFRTVRLFLPGRIPEADRREYLRSNYREGEAPAEPGLRLGRSRALPVTHA